MRGALPLAQAEPDTTAWFAIQVDSSTFGIVGFFPMLRASHPAIANFLDMRHDPRRRRVAAGGGRGPAGPPGWTARRSGRFAPRTPTSEFSRSPSAARAMSPSPADEVTLGPGDLVLLLGPAAAVQRSYLRAVGYGQTCRNEP